MGAAAVGGLIVKAWDDYEEGDRQAFIDVAVQLYPGVAETQLAQELGLAIADKAGESVKRLPVAETLQRGHEAWDEQNRDPEGWLERKQ